MPQRQVVIRLANVSDSVDVWNWRNDFSTRINSLNQTLIDWESHQKWFGKTLEDTEVRIYIGLVQGKKIGMCRFNQLKNENNIEVSINLNPQFRGQHLSRELLGKCIRMVLSVQTEPQSLVATVRETNLPSIKLFNNLGFCLIESIDGVAKFEYQKLVPKDVK